MSLIIFIYTLIVGSFLNVCIYRIPEGKSIIFPGSSCGSCHTRLKAKDLIPVLSWVSTKGTCRYCGEKVSIQYPLIELLTAVLTLLGYWQLGLETSFLWFCILLWSGIVITFIDLKYELIPDRLNLFIGIGALLFYSYKIYELQTFTWQPLLGALLGGGFLLFLAIVSSMGGGDIKYMFVTGFFLGPGLMMVALYIGFILGGLYALVLVIMKRSKKGMHIPFGPFLVTGVLIAYTYGPKIIETYLQWTNF